MKELKEEQAELQKKWQFEKEGLEQLQKKREILDEYRRQLEDAESKYDLNKAAELRHGKIPAVEKEIKQLEEALANASENRILREEVTADEIAAIVSRWTGIPVTKLMEGEREKLLRLKATLHERVVGQDEAVKLVTEAVWRARSGIKDPNRPIGSFIFLGPTGVGENGTRQSVGSPII